MPSEKSKYIFLSRRQKRAQPLALISLHIKLGTFSIRLVLEHLREQQCLPEGKAAKRLAAG